MRKSLGLALLLVTGTGGPVFAPTTEEGRGGAQGNRRREGESPAGAAAGGRGPLDRRRGEAARRESRHRSEPPAGDRIPGGSRAGPVKSATIARNYAEALFLAGEAAGDAA